MLDVWEKPVGHKMYCVRFQAFPTVRLLCGVNWLKFPDVSGLVDPIMGRTIRIFFVTTRVSSRRL